MNDNLPDNQSEILIYQTEDGRTRIDVRLEAETVWLSQAAMTELYQTTKQNVSLHLKNIFSDGELTKERVVKDYLTTAADGKSYRTNYYNLDAVIAVGYRIRSRRGTQFRIWATQRLREYIAKDVPGRVHLPPMAYCTDNAAMIAAAGYYRYVLGHTAELDIDAMPTWPLSEVG